MSTHTTKDQAKLKVVLIIGNGFDLNLGRKTSYKDFWLSSYCPKDYPAPLIRHLNSKWDDNLEAVKWYDLENELLAYYDMLQRGGIKDLVTPSEQAFLELFVKTGNINRRNYDSGIQEQINSLEEKGLLTLDQGWHSYIECKYANELILSSVERDKKAFQMIKEGLCSYLKESLSSGIDPQSIAYILNLKLIQSESNNNIDLVIYNFNYTEIPSIVQNISRYNTHGECQGGNIILGTKDYDKYNKDYDFLQKSFDANFNPPPIVYDLLESDDVIVFGHSLGINDSQYFEPFFKQQILINNPSHKRISIFTKDDNSVMDLKRSLQIMTGYNLSLLSTLNTIQYIRTDRIFEDWNLFDSLMKDYGMDVSYYASNFK